MKALTPSDLQSFMVRENIAGEVLVLDVPTPTVVAASQAVGAKLGTIIKSILFTVNGDPVLAIACGLDKIDRRAIAAQFGVGRKRVKLASQQEVQEVSGYEVGGMPPFGHSQPLPTLVDRRVAENQIVYGGGGAENALLRVSPQDVIRVTHAKVLDLLSLPNKGRRL